MRRGGKRIRMDEPPPPEFEPPTPLTPMDVHLEQMEQHAAANWGGYAAQTPQVAGTGSFLNITPEAGQDTSFGNQSYLESTLGNDATATSGGLQMSHSDSMDTSDSLTTEPTNTSDPDYDPNASTGRVTRARGRGRLPAKRPAVPDESFEDIPVAPARRGRWGGGRGGGRGGTRSSTVDESSLYAIILNGHVSQAQLVDDWIDAYKANREEALLQLSQFFIHASGCRGTITLEMQMSMDHTSLIRKMTEQFDEESGEYPLIMTGPNWKKFRQHFCDFVQLVVKQCQYSIIYDQHLMDNVIALLTGLTDSQVRAFRHTATLAAMKLMTALVDVALTVHINLDNTHRQYEAERQKTRERQATDRLENLLQKRTELEENMEEIKNMLAYMFKSIFVHRYRDTLPEIRPKSPFVPFRAICMHEIGIWMKKFHVNFLDDSYLKYIGWTLNDKVGDVRLKCLESLFPLYATEEFKSKLELFTSKFKDRIVSMTLDKEFPVAVHAVKLVTSILKHHRDILSDKDCEHVYELVFSSHRAVAQAAGEFINERLFDPAQYAQQNIRTRRGKKRLPNTARIKDLVMFFIESELHEHGAYLVDSLIESNDMVKDWECMTDLLLEEPGEMEEALDNKQETSLIEVMVCAVKQSATGEPPVGRGPSRKILSAKEVKQIKDDQEKLTEHFMGTLPPLLEKFSADAEKAANLLAIPQYFDLELYTTHRQEMNLELLLEHIAKIVDKHTSTEVLETAAKTLELLSSDDLAIAGRVDIRRKELLQQMFNKFSDEAADYNNALDAGEEPNEDETVNLVTYLKRMAIFQACHDFEQKLRSWDPLFAIASKGNDDIRRLPDEAIRHAIVYCYHAVIGGLEHVEDLQKQGAPVMEAIDVLRNKLDLYIDLSRKIMRNGIVPQIFREECYISLCDLLIFFKEDLGNENPALMALCRPPDQELQAELNHFIQEYVFVDDDNDDGKDEHAKIEELHKRRNFLASFAKLVAYNVIPVKMASDLFKQYVQYYNDYGDIIKATLGKAREINKVNCAQAMLKSLFDLYRALPQDDHGRPTTNHDLLVPIKELAKRFALSFGLDAVRNREAVTSIHREGIYYAIHANVDDEHADPSSPPPNLSFLEILAEFTNKLLRQDKRVVLGYLDRRVKLPMPSSNSEDWQPVITYRHSLMQGDTDGITAPTGRAYGRRGRRDEEGTEDGSEADF
ncbi:unnamed protein product [Cyprideis torosa]|uniref:Uncharacterized protein n=1 Tax=Cyprideis torosa TaxID=163714 RepID=A0A7R8W9L5_9CRUS|nr:unnamed protein product [Cyprideis torosa]CAG0884426.1 unnamed protein product [Cyprideis torosa]